MNNLHITYIAGQTAFLMKEWPKVSFTRLITRRMKTVFIWTVSSLYSSFPKSNIEQKTITGVEVNSTGLGDSTKPAIVME